MTDTIKLADATPGQRLRDSDGDEWVRTNAGAEFRLQNGVWEFVELWDVNRNLTFTLADDTPSPQPARWQVASTWVQRSAEAMNRVDLLGDIAPPDGDGWEPMNVDGARLWWRRRVPS